MKINNLKFEDLIIGFDGKRAVCNNTGIGNYSRYLIDSLSRIFPKNRYVLYSPKVKDNPDLAPLLARDNVALRTPQGIWKWLGSLWRSFEVTRTLIADDVTLMHGLSNELPLNIDRAPIPSVVTIHDLIWRRIPQNYKAIDRKLYDFKYRLSALKATRVIAISQRTCDDLIQDFGINPHKIDVIRQGCNPIFSAPRSKAVAATIAQQYQLPETYIITVGTVEYRKNQLLAVKALRGLPQEVKLVIVGRRTSAYAKQIDQYIASNALSHRVIWLTDVPTIHLPYLYAGARIASYTSRYEGFGLPIIEALSTGTPVIAATGSCLEEAGGTGAIYVDPDDVDQYVDAADRLIHSDFDHRKYASNGARHIRKFTAEEFAMQTLATYTQAIIDKYDM